MSIEFTSTFEVGQVGGNYYDKYNTANPIARHLMRGFLDSFQHLVLASKSKSFYEVGCGEGELALHLAKQGFAVNGSDIAPECVADAQSAFQRHGLPGTFRQRSLLQLSRAEVAEAECLVCCEVFEHLDEPEAALRALVALKIPKLIASVPREPMWCALNVARGKYWNRLGNTPGHVNHWGRRSFLRFLERHYRVSIVKTPIPWTMVLAELK